jgi:DivIVA domain-containing protein
VPVGIEDEGGVVRAAIRAFAGRAVVPSACCEGSSVEGVDLAAPTFGAGVVILRVVADDDSPQMSERESERLVPAEIRNVSFPVSVRGYDRPAVDAYVKRVNRAIAELEVGRSPQAAVRHALEQLREQTSGILQRARETAEEITTKARQEAEESTAREKAEAAAFVVNASAEADAERAEAAEVVAEARAEAEEILARARAEAEEILARSRVEATERLQRSEEEVAALREQAEAQMRALRAATGAVGEERRELLDDIRGMAARLQQIASEAAVRFPPGEPAESVEGGMLGPEAEAETQATAVAATDEPQAAMSAVGSHEGGEDEPPDEQRE